VRPADFQAKDMMTAMKDEIRSVVDRIGPFGFQGGKLMGKEVVLRLIE
jgi:hypothetical protein